MEKNSFRFLAEQLKLWHKDAAPDHPWKQTDNPYYIWLSEIILQQTRIATGTEYYLRFIESYPTVQSLAEASEDEVLSLWQGLGYYNRARNLHKTAKLISSDAYQGDFPQNSNSLLELPGVGPYTSAAIASFAFDEKIPVVDGNVYRVLSRYFGDNMPIDDGKKSYEHYAQLSKSVLKYLDSSAEYNQAIMDFGAMICTPSPHCEQCPLSKHCIANAKNLQKTLPVKLKKTKLTNDYLNYLVLYDGLGNTLLSKRSESSYWPSLYEPFSLGGIKKQSRKEINTLVSELTNSEKKADLVFSTKHVLSHKILEINIYSLLVEDLEKFNFGIITKKEEILTRPMPQPLYLYFKNNYLT